MHSGFSTASLYLTNYQIKTYNRQELDFLIDKQKLPDRLRMRQTILTGYQGLQCDQRSQIWPLICRNMVLKNNRNVPRPAKFPRKGSQTIQARALLLVKSYCAINKQIKPCQITLMAQFMLENMLTASDEQLYFCFYHLMEVLGWKEMFKPNSPQLQSTVSIIETKMEVLLPEIYEHICEIH